MPQKKKTDGDKKYAPAQAEGLRAQMIEQLITQTLELNYMPYAMSVIVSRAIPEIDGFKPSHRKLLYTMYRMNLLGGNRTKSANVVGQTMRLNPHGDAAIYDTMVRLSKGYEALLLPFIDSKGNFGKVYSRDMACAAPRYTEVRLSQICAEIFRDIDRDTVDFVDNYDNTMQEPTLLPTTFPNILVSANQGIAVGMASFMCGFHLGEVCDTTIEYMKNPDCDLHATLKAPDFPTGGEILYDAVAMDQIYRTGRGSFKVRARWRYQKAGHLIEIYEIPYSTTVEAIMDKTAELIRQGKIREIADMRDEIDKTGLKLTIDLKRGAEPEKLMQKLFRLTTLQDSISCNFNILIAGTPRVMGVREILEEWTSWRMEGVRRRAYYEMTHKKEKLHLLRGLQKILLDIDRAIQIIRDTDAEGEVVPNLMIGFGIDLVQAEYVADIRLRNINRAYILNRMEETSVLEGEIIDLADLIQKPARVRKLIIAELENVRKKYAQARKTGILYDVEPVVVPEENQASDYPVRLFLSRDGYFKKITPLSLRMGGAQKYKEGDALRLTMEASNLDELLVFTDQQQCYKTWLEEFEDTKASLLGDYLPARLGMDPEENVVFACVSGDYSGSLFFFFENGKVARVDLIRYKTVSRRKKLTNAYSSLSPLASILYLREDAEVALYSTEGRGLLIHTAALTPKATRSTQGVTVMQLKPKYKVQMAKPLAEIAIVNKARYRTRKLPASGALLKEEDREEKQMTL